MSEAMDLGWPVGEQKLFICRDLRSFFVFQRFRNDKYVVFKMNKNNLDLQDVIDLTWQPRL